LLALFLCFLQRLSELRSGIGQGLESLRIEPLAKAV
jgi:hypothetical protein